MDNISIKYSEEYLQLLLAGNRAGCSELAYGYLKQNNTISDLYEKVFKVALYRVGELWEQNKISVATEHMATAVTESILNELFEQIVARKSINKKVVLTCVDKELHQVGIKMVADVFEMQGWESYFLGTGIPYHELKRYLNDTKPDILAISLSIYFNYSTLLKTLDVIRKDFPDLPVLVGGQAFKHVSATEIKQLEKVHYFPDLYILEKFVDSLN